MGPGEVVAVGIPAGSFVWNVMLHVPGTEAMNVDGVFRVSGQDVASAKATPVVGVAAIEGIITLFVDLFT